jgi:DeoR family fructose operon transcriptional repressor
MTRLEKMGKILLKAVSESIKLFQILSRREPPALPGFCTGYRTVLVEERRKRILDLVRDRGIISLAELSRELEVSESTARRDLGYWHGKGVLKRTHGGAIYTGQGPPLPPLEARANTHLVEKRRIARIAAGRVHNGDAVLLDGGTTTLEVAKLLVNRPLQIVTNSLPIAALFLNSGETDLVLLGGYVFPTTGVAVGPMTIRMLEDLHVTQAILSVSGISERGLFNSNPLLVETQQQMMRCADEVVIVADHSKVGRQGLAWLCDFACVDTLIVDHELTSEQLDLLNHAGPRLILTGKPLDGQAARRTSP